MMFIQNIIQLYILQIVTPGGNCIATNLYSCFQPMYTAWFSIAGIAAVAVLGILILIYSLFRFTGRSDITVWTRVKIYDVLLSIVLIIAFAYAANIIYNLPLGYLNTNMGIVPTECLGSMYNIYSLSVCDMSTFNYFTGRLNLEQYYLMLIMGTIQPSLGVSISYPSFFGSIFSGKLSAEISFISADISYKYLGTFVDAIYVFVLGNDLQLIILSSAAVIFAILMSLGLIARIFGISRTFGGAMIAFALGIGILYPILTIIDYGFINVAVDKVYPASISFMLSLLIPGVATGGLTSVLYGAIVYFNYLLGNNIAAILPTYLFAYVGIIWIGLTLIPLINLVIVDVFIIDFSQAIGERMDLLSLLIRIL